MARTRGRLGFEPSRLDIRSSGDVQVGAYARRQLRHRILMGLLGLLLIGGAVGLYYRLRPPGAAGGADEYPVQIRCLACGHTAIVYVPHAQVFPMKCPKCRELAAQPVWECRDCGRQFVPEQTGGVVHCPKCGSERVGSAISR